MENIEYENTKLSKLKNDVELLEKQMSLTSFTQRMDSVSIKSEMKKVSLDIKHLRLQIEELKADLNKQKQSDVNLIREILKEKCPAIEVSNAPSAKDVSQLIESRLLDLGNKSQSLSHCVELKKRNLRESKQTLREVIEQCREDFYPTEMDCIQHLRELKIEHAKALKNISDCENAKAKLKLMLEQLQRRGKSFHILLEKLIEEKKMKEILEENITEAKAIEEIIRFEENLNSKNEVDELVKLKNEISEIKDTTASYGVQDIVSKFLEQEVIRETLVELNKKAEKRLQELKEEKRVFATKRSLIKEVDSHYPKSDMESSLSISRLDEQEKRLESAKAELERVNYVSNKAMKTIERLILKMKPKKPKEFEDKTVDELSKHLESHVLRMLATTQRMNKLKCNRKRTK